VSDSVGQGRAYPAPDLFLIEGEMTMNLLLLVGVKGETQILPAETEAVYGVVATGSETVSLFNIE
jgi:hypothetical protein